MPPELEEGLKVLNDLLARVQQAESGVAIREKILADAVERMSSQLDVLTVVLSVAALVIGVLAVVAAMEGAKRCASDFLNNKGMSLIDSRLSKLEIELSRRLDEKMSEFDKKAASKFDDLDNLVAEVRRQRR